MYALVVGKNGAKLKPVPADAVPAFRSSMNPDATVHSQQTASLAMFTDFLTPYVDRPVLDMTEMKGLYQIGMDIARQSR